MRPHLHFFNEFNPVNVNDPAPRLPRDVGVVWSTDHGQVAVYHLVPSGSGTKVEVRLLGSEEKLAPSAALRDVIQADMKKRGLYK